MSCSINRCVSHKKLKEGHQMKKIIFSLFTLLLLTGCSDFKPTDEDIVARVDGVTNYNTFLKFLENIEQRKEDKIRIVHYTTEGDPILSTLSLSGKVITYTYDSTRDQYGPGEILTTKCKSIKSEKTGEKTTYSLTECEGDDLSGEILMVGN